MPFQSSKSNERALRHLKTIKPYDGWSLDFYTNSAGNESVMLRRRNVPLYKKGFEAIAYDERDTKCVVGITSLIGDTEKHLHCRGVVLVDKDGAVARDQKEVRIALKKGGGGLESDDDRHSEERKRKELDEARKARKRNLEHARRQNNSSGGSSNSTTGNTGNTSVLPDLSDEQTSQLAKLGLIFIGVVTILRIFASIFFTGYVLLLPLVILYAMSTCPSDDSFDAKKELKRVLRG